MIVNAPLHSNHVLKCVLSCLENHKYITLEYKNEWTKLNELD